MITNARIKEVLIALGGMSLFAALVLPHTMQPTQDSDRFDRIAAALEAYAVDNAGKYPPHKNPGDSANFYLPDLLTTPIAYLSAADLHDQLATESQQKYFRFRYANIYDAYLQQPIWYPRAQAVYGQWIVWSTGYDRTQNFTLGSSFQDPVIYDATNGTISFGDILRSQRMQFETGM